MLGCKDLHNSFFDGFVFGCTDVVAFTKRYGNEGMFDSWIYLLQRNTVVTSYKRTLWYCDTFPFTDKQPTWVEDPVNLDNQVIHRDKFMGGRGGGINTEIWTKDKSTLASHWLNRQFNHKVTCTLRSPFSCTLVYIVHTLQCRGETIITDQAFFSIFFLTYLNKENDCQEIKALHCVKNIILISTTRNKYRTEWGIHILMIGCLGLVEHYFKPGTLSGIYTRVTWQNKEIWQPSLWPLHDEVEECIRNIVIHYCDERAQ